MPIEDPHAIERQEHPDHRWRPWHHRSDRGGIGAPLSIQSGHYRSLAVACGSGTYIRSLAHDLGQLLHCGAYLAGLRRTRVGEHLLLTDGAGLRVEGEVVAVGPGRIDDNGNRVPLDVAVGDKVIYSKYGGTEVKYAGEEYLILSARDVLAVVS